jgi:hypothetical protein
MHEKKSYARGRELWKENNDRVPAVITPSPAADALPANQLGRRNLTHSQRAVLAVELEHQLAKEAQLRRRATLKQNRASVQAILPEREKGQARDKTAALMGVSSASVQQASRPSSVAPSASASLRLRGGKSALLGHNWRLLMENQLPLTITFGIHATGQGNNW